MMNPFEFFMAPQQHWFFRLLGFFVRIRAELFLIATVFVSYVTVQYMALVFGHEEIVTDPAGATAPMLVPAWDRDATVIILIATGGVLAIVPASRRYLGRRLWCVSTRHRIRACFTRSRMQLVTRNGRMPMLLWSRPSPVGERVRVWLPAGLAVKDIDHLTDELATACWAREARINPSRAQAALVVIEIVRRDPLASPQPLTPVRIGDLTGTDTTGQHDSGDRFVIPLPDRRTLTIPKTAPTTGTPGAGTTGTTARPDKGTDRTNGAGRNTAGKDTDPPVSGLGGMDVTDYI